MSGQPDRSVLKQIALSLHQDYGLEFPNAKDDVQMGMRAAVSSQTLSDTLILRTELENILALDSEELIARKFKNMGVYYWPKSLLVSTELKILLLFINELIELKRS